MVSVKMVSPIAVKALGKLIEIKSFSNPKYNAWWTSTATSFAEGNVAIAYVQQQGFLSAKPFV